MSAELTDTLCTRCGLCCDGSLLADVELHGAREAASLEALGLELEDDDDARGGYVLPLPCAALEGTRCGVYAFRPRTCRTFECRLLQETRRGAVSVEDATALIDDTVARAARVRALAWRAGQRDTRLPLAERAAEALARCEPPAPPARVRLGATLADELRALRTTLEARFLAGGPARARSRRDAAG